MRISFLIIVLFSVLSVFSQRGFQSYHSITSGVQQIERFVPQLKNKKVAIVTNASGIIGKQHLIDTLLKHGVNIVKIFGPEHGFRGNADAGEKVKSGKDIITNIPVISLYGSHKKPTKEDLKGIDIVVYDIQDVGVRFYTYISTMTYVMESCAENNKPLIILDRPNPNGFYIDGPVMTDSYKSFLGLHSVPLVYGMTCGEYAQMVNGEGWLNKKIQCSLTVVPLENYDRSKFVSGLPVKPSPNLPNDTAILMYPGLGLFEGTVMSLGRGTDFPFQVLGSPYHKSVFEFTPRSTQISRKPKYQDTVCYGVDLRPTFLEELHNSMINLKQLKFFYQQYQGKQNFFDRNFNYHAGNETLKQQIISQVSESEIRESWQPGISAFKEIRKKYLIYKDFDIP